MRLLLSAVCVLAGGIACPAAEPIRACAPSTPVTKSNAEVGLQAWFEGPAGTVQYKWATEQGTVTAGQNGAAVWRIGQADDGPVQATVEMQVPGGQPVVCVVRVRVAQASGSRDGRRSAFHAFITPKDPEPSDFGQYTYLIFAAPPKPADELKYRNILAELLRHVPATAELANYDQPRTLNGIFVPVRKAPEDANVFTDEQVGKILKDYDYTRATALLRRVPDWKATGIYLISASGPLLSQNTKGPFLVQDLSLIPGNLAPTWVGTFCQLASQAQYWKPNDVAQLILKVRLSIAVLAANVPQVQEAVKQWVSQKG